MLKLFITPVALAAIAAAAPAVAAPLITFTPGVYTVPTYTTAQVFQDFTSSTPGATYTPRAGESTTGTVFVQNTTVAGVGTSPYFSTGNNYLDIFNGSYTVNFAQPLQFFSFVLGSLDSFNSLTLTFAGGATTTYLGQQIIGAATQGTTNGGASGRVSFDLGGQSGITSATFASTNAAFEIDALASAVPEAATWAMMMVGMGMVGGALRRRRNASVRVSFA